jgi:hypothetical protein
MLLGQCGGMGTDTAVKATIGGYRICNCGARFTKRSHLRRRCDREALGREVVACNHADQERRQQEH